MEADGKTFCGIATAKVAAEDCLELIALDGPADTVPSKFPPHPFRSAHLYKCGEDILQTNRMTLAFSISAPHPNPNLIQKRGDR